MRHKDPGLGSHTLAQDTGPGSWRLVLTFGYLCFTLIERAIKRAVHNFPLDFAGRQKFGFRRKKRPEYDFFEIQGFRKSAGALSI